jgi:hypothetical protein
MLAAYNLRDTRPEMAPTDEYIIRCLEERWRTIGGPEALEKSRTPSAP